MLPHCPALLSPCSVTHCYCLLWGKQMMMMMMMMMNIVNIHRVSCLLLQVREYDCQDIPEDELYPALVLRSSDRNTVCICVQDADGWKFSSNTRRSGSSGHVAMPCSQVHVAHAMYYLHGYLLYQTCHITVFKTGFSCI